MLQSDDLGGAPPMDFKSWRALLRSNCGRDVEVTAPNAFAGWMRPFNACGLEATSVKIRWGSADPGCSDHRVERSYRAVSCDGPRAQKVRPRIAPRPDPTGAGYIRPRLHFYIVTNIAAVKLRG